MQEQKCTEERCKIWNVWRKSVRSETHGEEMQDQKCMESEVRGKQRKSRNAWRKDTRLEMRGNKMQKHKYMERTEVDEEMAQDLKRMERRALQD